MMVVNPALESVVLGRGGGKWRPQFHSVFAAAGMVPPGRKLRIRRPIPGARASLTPTTARITLQDLPDDVYESGPRLVSSSRASARVSRRALAPARLAGIRSRTA